MARSGRLLGLLQVLRTKTRAARAVDLASELGVSVRTLYRDIATLRAEGVSIHHRESRPQPRLSFGVDRA